MTDRVAWLPLAALLLGGCGLPEEPADHGEAEHVEAEARKVVLSPEAIASAGIAVKPVERRRPRPSVEASGRLGYDERRMAVATARIGGRVSKVVADLGVEVARGQALAWIDSPELGAAQAEYRRASSASRVLEAEVERAELLLEGGAISRAELLRRRGQWEAARANLASAAQTLHLLGLSGDDLAALDALAARAETSYPVRASIAGRVTERDVSVGQVVAADARLFVVARLDALWLTLQVFEKDLPAVAVGSPVSLQCESHPRDRFEGTIDLVADVVDPHSRTIAARAVIDNPDGKLKPGMFVVARIAGRGDEAAGDVPAVPLSAIARIEGRDEVFVARGDGAFERRQISLGRRWDDWAEVLAGVEPGEDIVVAGVFTLKSELSKGGLEGHDH